MFLRIYALLVRYKNISFGSFPRLISIFYWPSVQILFWGFFTNFLISNNSYQSLGIFNIILSILLSLNNSSKTASAKVSRKL